MTDLVRIWDRVMLVALFVLVIFIPYSPAVIQGCLLLILIAWLFKRSLLWRSKPGVNFLSAFNFPSQGIAWPLIILGVLIIVSIFFSCAPMLSLKKFFSRYLQQIFLMYVVIEIINSQKRLYLVMVMLLWTLIVVNADTFTQLLVGRSFIFSSQMIYQRVTGPMGHPNDLATLLITTIPIILVLILSRESWIPFIFKARLTKFFSILLIIIGVLSIISLGLSSSRGAWVSFTISMFLGSLLLKRIRYIIMTSLFLILFFLFFGLHFSNTRTDIFPKENVETVEKVEVVETKSNNKIEVGRFLNTSRRIEYWQTAMNMVKKYPVFGCGYNVYIQTLQKLNMQPVEYPHSSLLHITAELGFLGLIGYLSFFILIFLKGFRIIQDTNSQRHISLLAIGIYAGLIAWMIHSLLDTPWEDLQLSILLWMLFGVLLSLKNVVQK